MSDIRVTDLAGTLNVTADQLIEQMQQAGIVVSEAGDMVTEQQKMDLLSFLRQRHGKQATSDVSVETLTKRKTTDEIILGGVARRGAKTVTITRRKSKKRIYKPDETEQLSAGKHQTEDDTNPSVIEATTRTNKALVIKADTDEGARAEDSQNDETDTKQQTPQSGQNQSDIHKKLDEADTKRRERNRARLEAEQHKKAQEENALSVKAQDTDKTDEKTNQSNTSATIPPPAEIAGKRKPHRPERDKRNKGTSERVELHIAEDKTRRRKGKKALRRQPVETPSGHGAFTQPTAPVIHEVNVPDNISVSELAQCMSVKAPEVIKKLMGLGVLATINQVLDQDTAVIVVEEMGHIAKPIQEDEIELVLATDDSTQKEKRAPVVTVMGHVDHGKTSLLDYIRNTKVTSGESGGITQHIGAYKVSTDQGDVVFLDTPGHAAFSQMRQRGARVTDIVVLVVAADDGVMPQTVEAIKHAQEAQSPLIVAINKIDKEGTNPERVKTALSNHDVVPEDWGGDVQFVSISALTGQGVDDLLAAISAQAEIMELAASTTGSAKGVVIESRLDRGRGTVITVLVQTGTLKKSDIVVVGQEYGRVRALFDETGSVLNEAGPSTPVEVLGLSSAPSSGDELQVAPDERKARDISNYRKTKAHTSEIAKKQAAKRDEILSRMGQGDIKTLNVIVKADVHGSAEAVSQNLLKLSTDEVKLNVVASGIGGINETDAQLAVTSGAILIGFNVRADNAARKIIAEQALNLQYCGVIYDLLAIVKQTMTGMLDTVYKDEIIGLARVDDVFRSPKFGDIAGCLVIEGVVRRTNPIRVLRDSVVIYEGELESLRRFKDDVAEVISGVECGIGVRGYKDVQPGDQIEVFERVLMT